MAISVNRAKAYEALLDRFHAANPTVTPLASTDPAEIGEFLVKNAPPGSAKTWLAELMAVNAAGPLRTWIGPIMLGAAGIAIAGGLFYGIFFRQGFLETLAEPASARGLVTFLFAFATIAVVLITAIATFWVGIDEVEKRGSMAKEVLAILIGIMGTILGFYFGSAPGPEGAAAPTENAAPQQIPSN